MNPHCCGDINESNFYVVACDIYLLKNLINSGFTLLPMYTLLFWWIVVCRIYFVDVEKGLVSRGWKPWHPVRARVSPNHNQQFSKHKLLNGECLALNGDF